MHISPLTRSKRTAFDSSGPVTGCQLQTCHPAGRILNVRRALRSRNDPENDERLDSRLVASKNTLSYCAAVGSATLGVRLQCNELFFFLFVVSRKVSAPSGAPVHVYSSAGRGFICCGGRSLCLLRLFRRPSKIISALLGES